MQHCRVFLIACEKTIASEGQKCLFAKNIDTTPIYESDSGFVLIKFTVIILFLFF